MIVVDEAHNLPDPGTQRAEALSLLLGGTPPKDVVLLTATPVNNSLWDLYSLLYSKRYYPNDTVVIDGRKMTITFPTPRVLKVDYNLDDVLPGFFDRFARALDGSASGSPGEPDVLSLARYAPSRYRVTGVGDTYELQLAGLLRSGLLKRFESSAFAFARTCHKMAGSHDAFLALLQQGKVATGVLLADWMATDTDDLDDVADYLADYSGEFDDAAEYDAAALATAATGDRGILLALAAEAETVNPDNTDPKLAALVEELADIAAEADSRGGGALTTSGTSARCWCSATSPTRLTGSATAS